MPGPVRFLDYGPYAVWFHEKNRTASLTVHHLQEHAYGNNRKRPRSFQVDSQLPAELQVDHGHYLQRRHEGHGPFSRGHLVPFGDMDSREDETLSFKTTNVAPIKSKLDNGPWNAMEIETRQEVADQTPGKHDRALVFLGLIYREQDTLWIPLDEPRVRVPGGVFKVVYFTGDDLVVDRPPKVRVWMQGEGPAQDPYRDEALESVEALEELTGIDLLP